MHTCRNPGITLKAGKERRPSFMMQGLFYKFRQPLFPWPGRVPRHNPRYRPLLGTAHRDVVSRIYEILETPDSIRNSLYDAKGEKSMHNNL